MKLKVVTPPTVEPVTVAECRAHMHLDSVDDDTYIGTLITAARQAAELFTRRAFVNTVFGLAYDEMPGGDALELMRAPLVSVASVKWYTDASVETTIAASTYHADTYAEPGRVVLREGEVWPSQGEVRTTNGLIVQYTAGYGTAATDVPMQIRTGIKAAVKAYYDGDTTTDRLPAEAEALLRPYRIPML